MNEKNRIVFNPVDTGMLTDEGNISDELICFLAERARGGAGIIIIDFEVKRNMTGLGKLIDTLHSEDSRLFIRLSSKNEIAECSETIFTYILECMEAGIDGIELYDENSDSDFVEFYIKELRNRFGESCLLAVGIPAVEKTENEIKERIDFVKQLELPVIVQYDECSRETAEHWLNNDSVDFIGTGRAFVADENWGLKICTGKNSNIRKCISCLRCCDVVDEGSHINCSVNPRAGFELEFNQPKKNGNGAAVAVIGGGPAGLAAATLLQERGFTPTVFEKNSQIGGQALIGQELPEKEKLYWSVEFYKNLLKDSDMDIRLNCEATPEQIKALDPLAVLVATGSVPVIPESVPGIHGANVYLAIDVLRQKITFTNSTILVIGAGLNGIERAEQLRKQGNEVYIADMKVPDEADMQRLDRSDIICFKQHQLCEIESDCVILRDLKKNELVRIEVDAVVLALGVRSDRKILNDLKDMVEKLHIIGDAKRIGNVGQAIREGYREAYYLGN